MFSLFNLQGTRRCFDRFAHRFIGADASAANFDMISQTSLTVKNFFQILSGFFRDIRTSSEALAYSIIALPICQQLFSIFSIFFVQRPPRSVKKGKRSNSPRLKGVPGAHPPDTWSRPPPDSRRCQTTAMDRSGLPAPQYTHLPIGFPWCRLFECCGNSAFRRDCLLLCSRQRPLPAGTFYIRHSWRVYHTTCAGRHPGRALPAGQAFPRQK